MPVIEADRQESTQIRLDLQRRFAPFNIDLSGERVFVQKFFGVASLPPAIVVPREYQTELEEIMGYAGSYRADSGGFYSARIGIAVIYQEKDTYGELDNFVTRRKAVHELGHAVGGEVVRPRLGFLPSVGPSASFYSWGDFLEEGTVELVASFWIKEQLYKGNFPEVTKFFRSCEPGFNSYNPDASFMTVPRQRKNQPTRVPIIYMVAKTNRGTELTLSSFAAMGVNILTHADKTLLDNIKAAKRGELEGMRNTARIIDEQMGQGGYGYLQRTPENYGFIEKYDFILKSLFGLT